MAKRPLVITIVGAESSGKTTLAKQLADDLVAKWVPEYARNFLDHLDRPYTQSDLNDIAAGQASLLKAIHGKVSNPDELALTGLDKMHSIAQFTQFVKSLNTEVVIVDGGVFTVSMWSKIKYGSELPLVEDLLKEDPTDIYLLCKPRKDWTFDPLREAPGITDRVWIYNQYLKTLLLRNHTFLIVQVGSN